jgi:ectoine hydroxylase-related dioxygenase (phytanoyl-CoA dioxygenase family)
MKVSAEQVEEFQRRGFIKLSNILPREEL